MRGKPEPERPQAALKRLRAFFIIDVKKTIFEISTKEEKHEQKNTNRIL